MKLKVLASLCAIAASSTAFSALTPVWQFDDFKMPESVVFDEKRGRYYVSNINQAPAEDDGNGSIGYIEADGKTHKVEWVKGLNSPKGIALRGKNLYVADVHEVVVVDVESGYISARYPAPNSSVLNGIALAKDGTVYVSDWFGNRIYQLGERALNILFESSELESPNGLHVKGDWLYVASWGAEPQADFSTKTSGSLKRLSLKTNKLEPVGERETWMNLDGLHSLKSKSTPWMATDFMKGELLKLGADGNIKASYKLAPSSADFEYLPKQELVIVPYLMTGQVIAYTLDEDK